MPKLQIVPVAAPIEVLSFRNDIATFKVVQSSDGVWHLKPNTRRICAKTFMDEAFDIDPGEKVKISPEIRSVFADLFEQVK